MNPKPKDEKIKLKLITKNNLSKLISMVGTTLRARVTLFFRIVKNKVKVTLGFLKK